MHAHFKWDLFLLSEIQKYCSALHHALRFHSALLRKPHLPWTVEAASERGLKTPKSPASFYLTIQPTRNFWLILVLLFQYFLLLHSVVTAKSSPTFRLGTALLRWKRKTLKTYDNTHWIITNDHLVFADMDVAARNELKQCLTDSSFDLQTSHEISPIHVVLQKNSEVEALWRYRKAQNHHSTW